MEIKDETYFEILVDGFVLNGEKFKTEKEAIEYLDDYDFNEDEKIKIRKTIIHTELSVIKM